MTRGRFADDSWRAALGLRGGSASLRVRSRARSRVAPGSRADPWIGHGSRTVPGKPSPDGSRIGRSSGHRSTCRSPSGLPVPTRSRLVLELRLLLLQALPSTPAPLHHLRPPARVLLSEHPRRHRHRRDPADRVAPLVGTPRQLRPDLAGRCPSRPSKDFSRGPATAPAQARRSEVQVQRRRVLDCHVVVRVEPDSPGELQHRVPIRSCTARRCPSGRRSASPPRAPARPSADSVEGLSAFSRLGTSGALLRSAPDPRPRSSRRP